MLFCKQTAGSCFFEMTWIWFGSRTFSLIFGSKNSLQLVSKLLFFIQRCPTLACSNAHVPYASWIHFVIKLFLFDLVLSKIHSCVHPKLGLCCCVLPVTLSYINKLMKKRNSLIFLNLQMGILNDIARNCNGVQIHK